MGSQRTVLSLYPVPCLCKQTLGCFFWLWHVPLVSPASFLSHPSRLGITIYPCSAFRLAARCESKLEQCCRRMVSRCKVFDWDVGYSAFVHDPPHRMDWFDSIQFSAHRLDNLPYTRRDPAYRIRHFSLKLRNFDFAVGRNSYARVGALDPISTLLLSFGIERSLFD